MLPDATYDVFLSHASLDKPAVEKLGRQLRRKRLNPFLDIWHLVPGEPWQEALEEALDKSQTVVVFLGPGGLGPWHNEEMRHALAKRASDKARRVIPVLLPGALMPDEESLPPFLGRLTWVDFRRGLADPDAFHRLVCGIKGIPPGDRHAAFALPPSSPVRPTMIGVPHRNPSFTGREALLSQLHQQLQAQGISALAQAALHGLGGIGKTQTAIEYAHRFGEHYRFILWVVAEEETAIRTAYLSIARELGLVEANADLERAVLAVKSWLAREDGWLQVFDNADDPALLRPYLPPVRTGGKVLLTSRAKSFVNVGIKEPFQVKTLEPKDAVAFLIERTGNTDAQAAALAAELGYLPLALEQAAAYIEIVGGSFAEYLARYHRKGVTLFAKGKPTTDYPKTVATTWSLSFDAVHKESPASTELLNAVAFLVPDSIPIEIFLRGGSKLGGLLAQELEGADKDPFDFWELLAPLERYSLLERLPGDAAFKLHRLTQEVLKDSLGKEGRKAWIERVVKALNATYPVAEFKNWQLCERLQPHTMLASELVRAGTLAFVEAGQLFNEAGVFARARGDFANAKLLAELSLGTREQVLGAEHSETLVSKDNFTLILQDLGNLAGAKKLHEQILETRERVLGGEHPDTLTSRNNLAETVRSIGYLTVARKLHEQTLDMRERILGNEHPDTLMSKKNLAGTLRSLGDLAGARTLLEQTMGIVMRVLGNEHPFTLSLMNSLALTHYAGGNLADAGKLLKQTQEIRERILGGEHPDTTVSTWNLFWMGPLIYSSDAEFDWIDKLRWLLDRDEGSIASATQRGIRQSLIVSLNPS